MEILLRVPCHIHPDCDETHRVVAHTTTKAGPSGASQEEILARDPDAKIHDFCEGELPKIRKALLATGSWTCPVCGVTMTYDKSTKTASPNLVVF